MAEARTEPTIRSLGLSVYAPAGLFSIGQGAVIPIMAIAAIRLGASPAAAGLIVALRSIGLLTFDVPAGMLVTRLGERRAMICGTSVLLFAVVILVSAPSPFVFGIGAFLLGGGWAVWLLARLSYVSDVMPIQLRGRALSLLGGIGRIGNFVGPFVGAVAIHFVGLDGAFAIQMVAVSFALLMLFVVPEPIAPTSSSGHAHEPFLGVIRANRHVFATAGVGVAALAVMRASRDAVLPLWALDIGLEASAVALVYGISAGFEMTLFYPAGSVMDRFGRKFAAVPCMILFALGFVLLPIVAHDFWTITLVGILLGFGNGMGSGIVNTLGADHAPVAGRAAFLGAWRFVTDVGTAGGPLMVGTVVGLAGIAVASTLVGAIGFGGMLLLAFRMPEPLHRVRRERAERARELASGAGLQEGSPQMGSSLPAFRQSSQ